jgi:NAD(P)-dependent dehydrogenase (short-subunit alcohol dehydrogenase family)
MKKVLITGGNGDIAKSIIKLLQEQNEKFEVISPDRFELDVTDYDKSRAYIEKHCPDIIINNAGYIKVSTLVDDDFLSAQQTIDVNLTSIFNLTIAAVKYNPQVQVINIGSSAATKPRGSWSSYCATKAALVMATKCWADEGVNTICLSPGRTVSKMRESLFPSEDQSELMLTSDFSRVVMLAIECKYENGSHINVNVSNVRGLINE